MMPTNRLRPALPRRGDAEIVLLLPVMVPATDGSVANSR